MCIYIFVHVQSINLMIAIFGNSSITFPLREFNTVFENAFCIRNGSLPLIYQDPLYGLALECVDLKMLFVREMNFCFWSYNVFGCIVNSCFVPTYWALYTIQGSFVTVAYGMCTWLRQWMETVISIVCVTRQRDSLIFVTPWLCERSSLANTLEIAVRWFAS